MMTEVLLKIDPSTLNVIKYIVVALILTPLFEILTDSLVGAKSTYDVLHGHTIEFSDSQLGIFSLHGTYWGRRRNRFILLALGIWVIGTELLFEFSFSSTMVNIENVQQVWEQPNHTQRYIATPDGDEIQLYGDPTEFPGAVAWQCINGPLTMLRHGSNHSDGNELYEGGLEFRLNGTYNIRRPYRARSDDRVLCSAVEKTAEAHFIVPRVVRTRTASQVEGVSFEVHTTGYEYIESIFNDNPPDYIPLILSSDKRVRDIRSDNNGTCADELCIVQDRDGSFVVVFWDFVSFVVVMKAYGNALAGLSERGRQIRLMLTIVHEGLFRTHVQSDLPPSLRVSEKIDMETLIGWMLVVANEEGVGGLKAATVNRTVVGGSQQVATATGLLPASISGLALIGGSLLASYFFLRVLIARKGDEQQPFVTRFWQQWRLQTTKQYMREKLLEDLQLYGFCESATLEDIALRLDNRSGAEESIRLLPIDVGKSSGELSSIYETRN